MMLFVAALMGFCPENRSAVTDEEGFAADEKSFALKSSADLKAGDSDMFLLVGTYTSDEGSRGIYIYQFNIETGVSDFISVSEAENPSYLTISPDENHVYGVGEKGEHSEVYAFSFDKKKGTLTRVNSQPTLSPGPCYITIDREGNHVHTANYRGGSISSFHVIDDGGVAPASSALSFEGNGPDPVRQEKAHVHSVRYSPDGRFIFATDLGSDKLYRFDVADTSPKGHSPVQKENLKEFLVPAGTGPRHFDFHPDGNYLYLLGELSGEVVVYDYNDGNLEQKQAIASDTVGARGSADIHVSPDGRFVYASNRLKADGIAIFSINPGDGTLTKVGYQPTAKHPRNFVITPNGKFLLVASRDGNKIEVFEINPATGLLTNSHQDILISEPVCLKFSKME